MQRHGLILVGALSVAACSEISPNHDTAEQCGCVGQAVTFYPVDSPVPSRISVTPCRTFTLSIAQFSDRPASSCSMPMICPPLQGGGANDAEPQVTGIDIARAVANPDVQEALRAAPIRYGSGPSDVGAAPLYALGVGGVEFEVGGPCTSSPCNPVPDGVQHFLDVMRAVNAQEIFRSPCREMLGK